MTEDLYTLSLSNPQNQALKNLNGRVNFKALKFEWQSKFELQIKILLQVSKIPLYLGSNVRGGERVYGECSGDLGIPGIEERGEVEIGHSVVGDSRLLFFSLTFSCLDREGEHSSC